MDDATQRVDKAMDKLIDGDIEHIYLHINLIAINSCAHSLTHTSSTDALIINHNKDFVFVFFNFINVQAHVVAQCFV